MKFFILTLLFCFSFSAQSAPRKVIATIGEKKLYLSTFNRRYNETVKTTQNPPSRKEFLEDLINYETVLLAAKKSSSMKTFRMNEEINRTIYRVYLEQSLSKKLTDASVSIRNAELQKYYRNNPQVRLQHILIEIPPNANATVQGEALTRARSTYKKVKASKDSFEKLARLYSDDRFSKNIAGELGWQTPSPVNEAYFNKVKGGKVGSISGPYKTLFGYHIIKVAEKRTYEQADKNRIRTAIFEEKRKKLFDSFIDSKKQNYAIKKNESLL